MNSNMQKRKLDPYTLIWVVFSLSVYVLTSLLHLKWYFCIPIYIVSFILLISVMLHHEINVAFWVKHETRRALRQLKKTGDVIAFYSFFDKEFLPRIRKELPQTLYKYYSLSTNDEALDDRKFETLQKQQIWASLGSAFNDPFEGKFSYLTIEDCRKVELPDVAVDLWKSIVDAVKERTTIICFSQRPNDLAMWGYYTNAHKGFCVEYSVIDTSNLYPVIYGKDRVSSVALFIQFVYSFFCKDATRDEHQLPLKYMMFLNAFKDKSWEHEREIRAIFMDSIDDIKHNGQALDCSSIGVKPIRIYAGVNCSKEHRLRLKGIADKQGIEYEECHLSDNNFSVITETEY